MVGRVVLVQQGHIQKHMLFVVQLQQQEHTISERALLVLVPRLNVSQVKCVLEEDVRISDEVLISL